MRPALSVVIATFERRELVKRTIASVFAQELADDFETIVVVDGSRDGSVDALRRLAVQLPLTVLHQPNLGQAAARNAGLGVARGELVLFLDDDMLCAPGVLAAHVEAHRRAGEPLLVFGQVLVAPESWPTLATDLRRREGQAYERLAHKAEPLWPNDAVVDPNSSASRAELLACGGFDERLLAREVADLGLRLWKQGVRFHYEPAAVTYEVYQKTARTLVHHDAALHGRNEVRLCRNHPEYRPHSPLARLHEGSWLKRLARRIAVRLPVTPDPLLALPYLLAERLGRLSHAREAGIRLLQVRRGIASQRAALLELGSWDELLAEFGRRLSVLLYHRVGEGEAGLLPELTISPKQFEQEVQWLARRGYVGICPRDWFAWCHEGRPLPPRIVLLTFDDAYADLQRHAFPVLRRHGFGGALFVVSGGIGGTNTWDDTDSAPTPDLLGVEELHAWTDEGIEIGAHSRTHADLTALSAADLADEVGGSAGDLQHVVGQCVVSFAYPYGFYNDTVRREVERHFDLAFTTDRGLNDLSTDPHTLRRTMVQPNDSLLDLHCRLLLGWDPYERLRARIRVRTRLVQLKRLSIRGPGE